MVEYLVRTHLATNPGSLRPRGSIQRSSKHHTEHTSDGDASSLTHSLPTRHITQKNCKSTTVRRRVPENMELLAAKVVYSLTILTSSTQETRVRFPVVATNSVRPSGDVFFCPSFARGRGADTFHVTLHTETTTCTTFREVCDRIRARLALT